MSFDIGIKNMAYCILTNETEEISLYDWKVINIANNEVSDDKIDEYCNCLNKNKKICGKKPKYKKCNIFYCEKHAKSSKEWIIPIKMYEKSSLNKLKHKEVEDLCKELLIFNNDNMKITKSVMIDKLLLFFLEKCFEMIKYKKAPNAGEINLITLGRNMKSILDTIPDLDKITHVALENQISPIANRMKTIQGMLAQYFIMRFDDNLHISFVSSQNKLKHFAPRHKDENIDDVYKEHKKDAIFYTNQILVNNKLLSTWGENILSKKKDDLADCFLQGIWYFKHMKYITMNEGYRITYT
jgi:hypothetical protein